MSWIHIADRIDWIHIADRRVNDCTIVQYEDADGTLEYEVYRDDGTHLGWHDTDAEAEAATR